MSKVWQMVPLGEVLEERQEIPCAEAVAKGEMRIVAKIGFNDGQIQLRTGCETKTGMILIRPGDLLVSGINAAKGAIAIYGEENTESITATIHYGAYIPKKERVNVKYLWWLLRSRTFRDLLYTYVPGGIKTELKAKRLLPIPVPLPSAKEQQRLVAKINELASKINEARKLKHQTTEGTEKLIATLITQALKNIPIDRCLGDVLMEEPRNGWSVRCNNTEAGIPVLTLSAVTGFRYRETEFKRTSEPTSPSSDYWLRKGDLLITRSNTPELVGHAAIYNGSPSPCIYPDLMMRLVVNEEIIDKRFVHWWLRSVKVREYIRRAAKGTSPTMKKISQPIVKKIPFPSSSLSLPAQRRIVAYLDSLQTALDILKGFQNGTAAELDALLPSILDKAFKGEL
jgi:type I restriction enzyme S subunit